MIEKKNQYELAFAALLHDIGKFKQRAFGGNESVISQEAKALEGRFLSDSKDSRHALWTYSFFLQDLFPILADIEFDYELDWKKTAFESSLHHNPGAVGSISSIIARADCLSSSADRSNNSEGNDCLTTPLRPVFSNVDPTTTTNELIKSNWAYKMMSISNEEKYATFPVPQGGSECCRYKDLWDSFIARLNRLSGKYTCQEFLRIIKDLLYCYCWCIPSSTDDYASDISLYDHSITTMSFALALGCSTDSTNPFRLLAGDVSGIQQYIFQSKSESFKGAGKTFRGRSFIISLLAPMYLIGLCDEIGIIPFCSLIEAGGRFSLLLPNTEDVEEKYQSFQMKQEAFLLEKHLGTLCVVTDLSDALNETDFAVQKNNSNKGFKETLRLSAQRLSFRKTRKFELALGSTGFVFQNACIEGNRCKACGMRSASGNDDYCVNCAEERELGGKIPVLEKFYISRKKGQFEILKDLWLTNERKTGLDFAYSLSEKDAAIPTWTLNNYTPDKLFEEIAEKSVSEGKGKPFLAYIKIDVDHLGDIFIDGLPQEAYTVSRYVTLSRQLHHFFNCHVRSLLESEERFGDVYTVLSGGDDVFFIAPWTQAVPLVQQLHRDFEAFCCENSHITFSAGISIQRKKTPFAFGNAQANTALDEKAKEEFGRNCVCLFDHKYSFSDLEKMEDDAVRIKTYVENGILSMVFVYRMLQYVRDRLYSGSDRFGSARKHSSYSKFRYDIARNVVGRGHPEEEIEAINFLQERFEFGTDTSLKMFEDCLVSAIYSMRKEE